ncbi:unnamed protein product [Allacma fusca]|uniref:NF-X1-type domain-containing protein n=1 Tax=Allacma fusca TaxID=39272 RepID=A0A8J2LLQ0_9HEXA|nr:unnamed protein product [Allacma fusca]
MSTKSGLTPSNQKKKIEELFLQYSTGISPIQKKKVSISGMKNESINGKTKGSTNGTKTMVNGVVMRKGNIVGYPHNQQSKFGSGPTQKKKVSVNGMKTESINGKSKGSTNGGKTMVSTNGVMVNGNVVGLPHQPKFGSGPTQKKKDNIHDLFAQITIGNNPSRSQGHVQGYSSPHLGWSNPSPNRIVRYEDMSIIPTFREMLSTELPFLKPNKMFGAFSDPSDYLETHFRLFHEDFLRPLKIGLQDFIQNQRDYISGKRTVPKGNIRLYKDVKYEVPAKMKKNGNAHYVRLKSNYYFNVNWEEASHLLPGSLLILSHDNFASAYVATVQNYRNENLLQRGILGILWADEPPRFKTNYSFTMIESESFFQSYRYTLEVLQGLSPEKLPLSKYIVNGSSDVEPPKYLAFFSSSIKLRGYDVSLLNCKTWPKASDLNMNDNQFKALKSCLTKEFAIVQGPPGTGKTFLALQVVETLLRNTGMWNPKGQKPAPILIACYTNHALDQFLEGVLRIYDEIGESPSLVRVGGGGESEVLEKYNISKIKPDKRKSAVLHSRIVQHRMRPEISDLVTGTIYKDLKNAPNVLTYPQVLGMKSNLYFVTHEKFESPVPGSSSKVNQHEAEFLVSLCHYIIQQGYTPKHVTILATYNGQVDLIKEYIKRDEMCDQVDVTTVDGFQGKENDIILLSLVRSNDEAKIGFLKKNNRICVALSRAKHGLYIIGNMTQLAAKSKTWKKIQKKLNQSSAIGPFLPIQCQMHGKIQKIQVHQDFKRLAPEGGCLLNCGKKLVCGHKCQSICHKSDHDDYKCQLNCTNTCIRGHPCKAECYEPCPPCTVKWISNLPCSHEVPVPCFVAENEELTQKGLKFCVKRCAENEELTQKGLKFCVKRCGYVFTNLDGGCGHLCQGTCTSCLQGRFHVKCEAECRKFLPCGHKCESLCFEDCAPCQKKCTFKCEHSECNSKCGETCDDCYEPCGWSCVHESCNKLCFEICDRDPCNEPCSEILDCGHPCIGFCGEPCPAKCKDCNCFGFYKRNKSREADERYILLEDCGHAIEHHTLDNHLNDFDDKHPLSCPVPNCKVTITRSRRYNFQIKFGRKISYATKKNYEDELGEIRDQSVLVISSFIEKNTIVEKFFPYVKTFVKKKLSSTAFDGQLEREQFLKTDWWSLGVFKKFLEVARPFPWSKEEIKNSNREFHRLWDLSQSYYLTTLISCDISSKDTYTTRFDMLYNILGARRAYDETVQNQVETIFKELAVHVPDSEYGLELSKWIEKPKDFLTENDVRSYTSVKDIVACISATR